MVIQPKSQISFWNRKKGKVEVEAVYGDAFVRWLYGHPVGQKLTDHFLIKAPLSRWYGRYQSSGLSRNKIQPFIKQFKIPMKEYDEGPFHTFNDFFIRKFKPGVRTFVQDPHEFPAFCEARYFAYSSVGKEQEVPVKGISLSPAAMLGSEERAKPFIGGPLLLARLCPTDYHRFHFPDKGRVIESKTLHGELHSVNPLALKYKNDILVTNERQVSILETENFGKLAYVEVGALCVGKIVQTGQTESIQSVGHSVDHNVGRTFSRGDEKGYFLFGGSTVVVIGEPGKWQPDQDLLDQTALGRETLVQLGERVGMRV